MIFPFSRPSGFKKDNAMDVWDAVSVFVVVSGLVFVYLIISLESAMSRIRNLEEAQKFFWDKINELEDKKDDLHTR